VAAGAAAVAQNGPAALAPVAGQKTMLPSAADFGRLILSFHKAFNSRPENSSPDDTVFGNTPKFGTREHNSEAVGVKQASLGSDRRVNLLPASSGCAPN